MTQKKLERVMGCRVTEDEERNFSRIAGYLNMSGSELMRWFTQRAIEAEKTIKEEAREKGIILPPEAFLAKMDGHLSGWFQNAFLSTNWISKPEEIEAVALKLFELAKVAKQFLSKRGTGKTS